LRRAGLRGGARARARRREPAPRVEGRRGQEEEACEEAARVGLRALGSVDLRAARALRAGTARFALRGVARDVARGARARIGWLQRDEAARPRQLRDPGAEEAAQGAGAFDPPLALASRGGRVPGAG